MIIGIKFEIPNKYDSYLSKILKNIKLEDNIFRITEDDAFIPGCKFLFDFDTYDGEELKKIISKPSYYVNFSNIQRYKKEEDIEEINYYSDFLKNKCTFLMLVIDSIFVEVYSKDISEIETIKKNAEENMFTKIKYITDDEVLNQKLKCGF